MCHITESIIVLVADEIDNTCEYVELTLQPEKPRKFEENLIHDLYLEDFIDSEDYI